MNYKYDKFLKELLVVNPGTHAGFIVEDDLPYVLRRLKQTNKTSKRLTEVYNRSRYIKPSTRRRETVNLAKYIQQKNKERNT